MSQLGGEIHCYAQTMYKRALILYEGGIANIGKRVYIAIVNDDQLKWAMYGKDVSLDESMQLYFNGEIYPNIRVIETNLNDLLKTVRKLTD